MRVLVVGADQRAGRSAMVASSCSGLGPFDCITRDHAGTPYLRYFNHKMKREALVPIDNQLSQDIASQRQRVL